VIFSHISNWWFLLNSFQTDAVSLWAPCDHKILIACMWSMITCNWFNKNIKSLSKVQFEIKNKTLKMFLITKWENFINFKNKNLFYEGLWFLMFFPFEFAPNLQVLMNRPLITSLNLFVFLVTLLAFFFPSCQSPMLTSHLSFHAFSWINDTHQKKVVNPTTCSWDVKNTHDLMNS
jgi:hypothetical protein